MVSAVVLSRSATLSCIKIEYTRYALSSATTGTINDSPCCDISHCNLVVCIFVSNSTEWRGFHLWRDARYIYLLREYAKIIYEWHQRRFYI